MKKIYIVPIFIIIFLLVSNFFTKNNMNINIRNVDYIPIDGFNIRTAIFANGCFWCVEADIEKVDGVIQAVSGYLGGSGDNPSYENYAVKGHREVVFVTYNSDLVEYKDLVEHILKHGDPTDSEGSFVDRGVQYSPAIYYENDIEKKEAEEVIKKINALKVFDKEINIPVIERSKFWLAEEYHQDYAKKNTIKYNYYRSRSGRDDFLNKVWKN